jgi:two-component system CheB/CheR fusion protein
MNEELQSTNEELQTTNDELRQRSLELNHVNSFLSSILTSLHYGVVVIDREMQIQAWNYRAEDLWGLRSDEVVGKHFLSLDIGLAVEQLKNMIRGVISDQERREVVLDAVNRRGKSIECKVTCTALVSPDSQPHGAILLMEENGQAHNGP